jgi:hypothetical protein
MSSLRQIEANRRNARLSTGPITEEGKKKSRRNAVRHGLTAETVIDAIEDAEDYAAFEMAVTADYDAQSAVERELVLRLASLLWRLRRTTAIEAGLFKQQAHQLLRLRQGHPRSQERQDKIGSLCRNVFAEKDGRQEQVDSDLVEADASSALDPVDQREGLTRAFVGLSNLPTYPLDRLGRYEAALWRQARQILLTLRCLEHRKPWVRYRRGANGAGETF